MDFDRIYRSDTSITYNTVTGGRARYITISEEGWWLYKAVIYWDTDWTAGDFPYIEPSCLLGGFPDVLVNAVSVVWDDTQGIIYGEQFTAAESDHHSLAATVLFNFSAADVGQSTLPIGVNIRSSASRTKNFGGHVTLTRLNDVLTELAIV